MVYVRVCVLYLYEQRLFYLSLLKVLPMDFMAVLEKKFKATAT